MFGYDASLRCEYIPLFRHGKMIPCLVDCDPIPMMPDMVMTFTKPEYSLPLSNLRTVRSRVIPGIYIEPACELQQWFVFLDVTTS
jgi:hypothetical protein